MTEKKHLKSSKEEKTKAKRQGLFCWLEHDFHRQAERNTPTRILYHQSALETLLFYDVYYSHK
jgi:hypothetical protein